MKNLPFNTGSAAVTTPFTETGRERAARSAGREITSAALVSNSLCVCAWPVVAAAHKANTILNRSLKVSKTGDAFNFPDKCLL
ncbi:MAG TPA: hypothetical protein VF437_07705 [Verrucomicrobiae bacterium]